MIHNHLESDRITAAKSCKALGTGLLNKALRKFE